MTTGPREHSQTNEAGAADEPTEATEPGARSEQLHALGSFIRGQRQLANLSLRRMAELAQVSNPYLSQLERGLHEPSLRVLQSIARALNLSADVLLAEVGITRDDHSDDEPAESTERVIARDPALTAEQREALLLVYRSYVRGNAAGQPRT